MPGQKLDVLDLETAEEVSGDLQEADHGISSVPDMEDIMNNAGARG
jgi:hypothetical protein